MNAPLMARRAASSVCRPCRRSLLRHFSSTQYRTLPEFQSYRLNPQPPSPSPPRSAGGPDTSITHPIESPLPRVHETRPPRSLGVSSTSVLEQEAQKSQPEFASPTPQQAQQQSASPTEASPKPASAAAAQTPEAAPGTPKPRPRSKLRARKAAMKLTPTAVDRLHALLDQPDPKLIKVGVRNRGCSGLAYHLEYVDKPGAFDETVEQDGVKVLIDSKALFSIIGSEMDWVEDKLNQRFVFRNPNIKEQCGCGESFMV
ncbi:hypothetical protein VSDG_09649 [Cytospora chrysosperma]|uniref:Iron-sulfur assembly protein 1 n=1 Tax=Cytospora chrysosperma TaxID=252740 RepID=A0A423V9T9_CYTCH|nr:hypothetical protein VSDG_09649 [Valsa sordida]